MEAWHCDCVEQLRRQFELSYCSNRILVTPCTIVDPLFSREKYRAIDLTAFADDVEGQAVEALEGYCYGEQAEDQVACQRKFWCRDRNNISYQPLSKHE